MTAREEAREKIAKQREDERELKKVHAFYRALSYEDQTRVDEVAHRSAELELNSRGSLQIDLELLPITRFYGIKRTPISCAFARARFRFWMRTLREGFGTQIEDHWRSLREAETA